MPSRAPVRTGHRATGFEAHQPFAPRWPARFEQSQEQMIRVSADRDRLTVIVANEFACTDERFGDAFNGAPTRLRFEPIGGDILCFLPGAGELWVCLPEFVDTSSATAGDRDCSCHAASVGEDLQKAPLAHFGELQPIHSPLLTQLHRTSGALRTTDRVLCASVGDALVSRNSLRCCPL